MKSDGQTLLALSVHHYWPRCNYTGFLLPQDLPGKCTVPPRILQGLLGIWDMLMYFTCPRCGGRGSGISAWSGEQVKRDKGLINPAYERVLLRRMWLLRWVCMWTNPLVWAGAVSSKACAEGKGEVKKQKAAGVHVFLSITLGFLLSCFSGHFFKCLPCIPDVRWC